MINVIRNIWKSLSLWLTDPSPAGLFLFLTFLTLVTAVTFAVIEPVRSDTTPPPLIESEAFSAPSEPNAVSMIQHWIRHTPRHPLAHQARQARVAALAVAATREHETPLSLTLAMMFRESSGRTEVRGLLGEIGLMQVAPPTWGKFCRGLDRVDAHDQITCGHRVLRAGYERCSTWRGALTWYASRYDICRAKPRGNLDRVVKDRFKLAAELEGVVR